MVGTASGTGIVSAQGNDKNGDNEGIIMTRGTCKKYRE